jgi:LDH2 family malate/lactate/ureidoglycolate dehydrogenase
MDAGAHLLVRWRLDDLAAFGASLLAAAGMETEMAALVADRLADADAMGHTTHGLAQLPAYLDELESGDMAKAGGPEIVADRGGAVTWDGGRLSGVWLTAKALDLAIERARGQGLCAVAIRRSHHIACLAAFLPAAIEAGMLAIIASSDPSEAGVAPYRGRRGVFTPDPIAAAIPTGGAPILIDMSASITTMGLTHRLAREGRRFPGLWALDAQGGPTDDPAAVVGDPPGALLTAGGLDHGQKGYGLALLVEALTQGLSGYGRADGETRWGAAVFVLVIDPAAFGGRAAFERQAAHLAAACLGCAPLDPASPVRLPGDRALAGLARAKAEGVALYPDVFEALAARARRLAVTPPAALEP